MTFAANLAQSGSNNVTMRNRIINGAMVIDQRNAGASVAFPAGTVQSFVVDRWWGQRFNGSTAFSGQQSSVAPPGFVNSLLITTTTSGSPGSTDSTFIAQRIEGFNISDLAWGTANAQPVTLSFWTRSSLTGTFSGSIVNSGQNRSYPFTFVLNAANTWEQKTVTIPGDTSGTWVVNNGIGISLIFDLGNGSNNRGTAGSWTASYAGGVTGAVSVVGTSGATFYITGVQLEAGTAASPFENRLIGTDLSLCQRYYFSIEGGRTSGNIIIPVSYTGSAANAWLSIFHPVTMRTAPTVTTGSWIVGDPTVVGPGVNFTSFGVNWAFYFGETSYYRATAEL